MCNMDLSDKSPSFKSVALGEQQLLKNPPNLFRVKAICSIYTGIYGTVFDSILCCVLNSFKDYRRGDDF